MSTTRPAVQSIRYECTNGLGGCQSGNGKPKRKTCAHCGGRFHVLSGVWGVFVWTGTGRYPESDAVSLHRLESQAHKATAADTAETLVVRWIPER
jgi:hypothetical protein